MCVREGIRKGWGGEDRERECVCVCVCVCVTRWFRIAFLQVLVVCSPGAMEVMDNWQTMKTKEGKLV